MQMEFKMFKNSHAFNQINIVMITNKYFEYIRHIANDKILLINITTYYFNNIFKTYQQNTDLRQSHIV